MKITTMPFAGCALAVGSLAIGAPRYPPRRYPHFSIRTYDVHPDPLSCSGNAPIDRGHSVFSVWSLLEICTPHCVTISECHYISLRRDRFVPF